MLVRQQDKKYEAELAKLRVPWIRIAKVREYDYAEGIIAHLLRALNLEAVQQLAEDLLQAAERTAGGKCCGADQCVFCEASGGRDRLWR